MDNGDVRIVAVGEGRGEAKEEILILPEEMRYPEDLGKGAAPDDRYLLPSLCFFFYVRGMSASTILSGSALNFVDSLDLTTRHF